MGPQDPLHGRRLQAGDRVWISGGYDRPPEWLGGGTGYFGRVVGFLPEPDRPPEAVVRLEAPIRVGGRAGDVLVLTLRYEGAAWTDEGVVHLALLDRVPDSESSEERRRRGQDGWFVDSHGTYRLVADDV